MRRKLASAPGSRPVAERGPSRLGHAVRIARGSLVSEGGFEPPPSVKGTRPSTYGREWWRTSSDVVRCSDLHGLQRPSATHGAESRRLHCFLGESLGESASTRASTMVPDAMSPRVACECSPIQRVRSLVDPAEACWIVSSCPPHLVSVACQTRMGAAGADRNRRSGGAKATPICSPPTT
jgi:hypothetical protein